MNWLTYFEKYSSDRKLLCAVEEEITKLERFGKESGRLMLLRATADDLRSSINDVERFLDNYVSSANDPREAGKRAQEKLFISLRYRQDMSIEATAEAMGVSRDTAYRVRRRIADHGDLFGSATSAM